MPITINGTGPVGGVTTLTATGVNIENTGASANSTIKYSNSGKNWYAGLRGDTSNIWAVADDSAFRMTVDGSGNLGFNSGYGSVATAYGCRAWVNFNGSGGSSIRGSGNVSSVTRNAGGDYTVNFTTAMVDVNYCAMVSQDDATNDGWPNIWSNSNVATTSCRIGTGKRPGTGNNDRTYVGFAVFR
jgi:hypothetical protein